MNRGERREKSRRKWISRARKVYNAFGTFYVPKEGIKKYCCRFTFENMKSCESITDFLSNSKFAKLLKNCTVLYRNKMEQIEAKIANRKERHSSRKKINEGIEEYEHLNDADCSGCIYREECEKAINGNVCFKYWDQSKASVKPCKSNSDSGDDGLKSFRTVESWNTQTS